MARTGFEVLEVQQDDDFAVPYVRASSAEPPAPVSFASLGIAGPAGNVNSCLDDMVRWLHALLGRGILSASALTAVRTPAVPMVEGHQAPDAKVVGYGLGVMLEDYRGVRLVHHGGKLKSYCLRCQPRMDTAELTGSNDGRPRAAHAALLMSRARPCRPSC